MPRKLTINEFGNKQIIVLKVYSKLVDNKRNPFKRMKVDRRKFCENMKMPTGSNCKKIEIFLEIV